MEKEKYTKGGGEACSVRNCSNNRRKLYLWNNTQCEEHEGLKHKDCPCMRPYKLHILPKKEELRLQWIAALNRAVLPKNILVCSSHFLDGHPTIQNPVPKLNLGYAKDIKQGRRPPQKRSLEMVEETTSSAAKKMNIESASADSDIPLLEHAPEQERELPSNNFTRAMHDKGTTYEDCSLEDHGYSSGFKLTNSRSFQSQNPPGS